MRSWAGIRQISFFAVPVLSSAIDIQLQVREGGTATESSGSSVIEFIISKHRQYIESIRNLETDITYILGGTDMVFKLLLPEEELAGMKQSVFSTLSA